MIAGRNNKYQRQTTKTTRNMLAAGELLTEFKEIKSKVTFQQRK